MAPTAASDGDGCAPGAPACVASAVACLREAERQADEVADILLAGPRPASWAAARRPAAARAAAAAVEAAVRAQGEALRRGDD